MTDDRAVRLSGVRQTILNLLVEHQDLGHFQQSDVPGLSSFRSECSCGSRDGRMFHLADLLASRERAAAVAALTEAADDMPHELYWRRRAWNQWLRARAVAVKDRSEG